MMYLQTTALLALASSVSAHMRISEPVPFAWEDSAKMQFPLEPADFPCKQPSGKYAVTEMNKYNAGDNIKVQILGGATHGGGSCQFSITTDTKPTKDSQWKVLFSQIGGCPGGPPNDNKSNDPNDPGNAPFSVPIPKELPSGKYTFAWSWNNKLGNREFYMNCAPLEISGGSGTDVSKALGSLPDMFVINLPPTECKLIAEQDALYPNPGKNVGKGPQAVPGLKIEGSGCAAQTKLGAGAGKLGAPAAPTGGAAAPSSSGADDSYSAVPAKPTTLKSSAVAKPTGSDPVYAPGASSAAASAPATPKPTGSTTAPTTGGSSPSGCTPCSNDGALVCISSSSFGICDRGCAVAQPLAAGVTCSNGQIARRSIFGSWFN